MAGSCCSANRLANALKRGDYLGRNGGSKYSAGVSFVTRNPNPGFPTLSAQHVPFPQQTVVNIEA